MGLLSSLHVKPRCSQLIKQTRFQTPCGPCTHAPFGVNVRCNVISYNVNVNPLESIWYFIKIRGTFFSAYFTRMTLLNKIILWISRLFWEQDYLPLLAIKIINIDPHSQQKITPTNFLTWFRTGMRISMWTTSWSISCSKLLAASLDPKQCRLHTVPVKVMAGWQVGIILISVVLFEQRQLHFYQMTKRGRCQPTHCLCRFFSHWLQAQLPTN